MTLSIRHVEYEVILACPRGEIEWAEREESGAQTCAGTMKLAVNYHTDRW